jgi:hypothetical protein
MTPEESPPTDLEKPRHPVGVDAERSMPAEPPPIGSPCPSGATGCGKSGTVAVVQQRITSRRLSPPCALVPMAPRTSSDAVSACIVGDQVFVSKTCVPCRIRVEDRMLGRVSDMTPAQLEAAQKLAGLPEQPLLTTVDAWRGALDAARKQGREP